MRHQNNYSSSCLYRPHSRKCTSPYQSQYIDAYNKNGFARADKSKRYVQILEYVLLNDGCKRADIQVAVFGFANVNDAKKFGRGYASNIYSQLLYLDLIDYDDDFTYHIRPKGLEVLRIAYKNEHIKNK